MIPPLECVGSVKSLLSDGTEKNLRTKGNFFCRQLCAKSRIEVIHTKKGRLLLIMLLSLPSLRKIFFSRRSMRGNHVTPFAVCCLVFTMCSDMLKWQEALICFSFWDERLFYSATGLFHGG